MAQDIVKRKKVKPLKQRDLPTKRSINLAAASAEEVNYLLWIPLFVLVIAGAFLFSKVFVADRFMEAARAQDEVRFLQQQVEEGYERIEAYGDLKDSYAHYTYSDMTVEELTRADRILIIDMINTLVLPDAQVANYTIRGNELTLPILGASLQEINLIAQRMEDDPRVDFCIVTAANTNQLKDEITADSVTGQVTVYLAERGSYDEDSEP